VNRAREQNPGPLRSEALYLLAWARAPAMPYAAFACGAIFDNCPLKIESLAQWGSKLLVGTSEGLLLIMGEGDDGAAAGGAAAGRLPKYHIVDTKRGFSKKPIVQLHVLGDAGGEQMLVSLSDTITLHRLPAFELVTSLPKTKGCNLYCLSSTSPPVALCAAVNKKVLVYQWPGPGQNLIETKELTMPDRVKSAVFCGDSVCLGTKRDYFMVHTGNGDVKELFPVSRQTKDGNPVAVVLPKGEILLAQDSTGIFIGPHGRPTRKYGLHWTEPPLALALSYPYVLAASARNVDIRCIANDKKAAAQSEQLRGVHSLLAQPDAAGYGGKVFVASSRQDGKSQVHLMHPTELLEQVDELVGMEEYTEALALCDQIKLMPAQSMPCRESELETKSRSIHRQHGFKLFDSGDFDLAIERFEDAALHPQEVVDLFPELLWDGDSAATPRRIAHERQEPLLALTSYLETTRTKLDDSSEDLRVVNTALLKCYVLTHHAAKLSEHVALPAPLCPCDVPDCAGFLLQHSKEDEAVLMYKSHGRHRDALDLLRTVGKGRIDDGYDGCIEEGLQETVAYLQQLGPEETDLICEYSSWVLETNEDFGLRIFTGVAGPKPLDETRILRHLSSVRPGCVREYLEFVVDGGNTNEEQHNELVKLYLERLAAVDGDEYFALRAKLTAFLRRSEYYTPEQLLSNPAFDVDEMPEERAILLSRIGQHAQALTIYVHKIKTGGEKLAEEYCRDNYDPVDDARRDVYFALLKVYMKPEKPYEPRMDAAMRVLREQNGRLDTSKVLGLLPKEWTLAQLKPFLVESMRDINSQKRNGQVEKNILKGENIANKKARAEALYCTALHFKSIGDWQSALQHFERAAEIFAQAYGEGHKVTKESVAQGKFCMGGVYKNQRDNHSAANYYEQAAELFADTVGEEHPYCRQAREEELAVT
jgi:tetratricopeptide (TPR) repeat protein